MTDPAFSRSGVTHPTGKLTEQIPAVRISGETKERLEGQARQVNLTLQEYVRELLTIRAHGEEEIRSMYLNRVAGVSGSSKER